MNNIVLHGRIPSKKNGKIMKCFGKRPVLISTPAYQSWRETAGYELKSQKPKTAEFGIMTFIFYMPDNRRCDLSNKLESVMDLLVEHQVIKDDCWQEVPGILMQCEGVDKNNPRVEIAYH